jgi:ribosomal-protein-alanine N-acetyltransferase
VVPDDLERMFAIHGDAQTWTYLPDSRHRSHDDSAALLQRWIAQWQRHGFGPWSIRVADRPDIVGFGGLQPLADMPDAANLSCRLDPACWRQGYAGELVRESLALGFATLGLARIIARIKGSNAASRHTAERAGFRLVEQSDPGDGSPLRLVFAMTAAEYRDSDEHPGLKSP